MAKRRRRRFGVWMFLVGIGVLLILLGTPGRPDSADASPVRDQRFAAAPAGRSERGGKRREPGPARSSARSSGSSRAADQDRVRGLLHVARTALDEGRLGAALAVHDRLDVIGPVSKDLDKDRVRARRTAEAALASAVRRLAVLVGEGRILEAEERLGVLLAVPHPRVRHALEDLARSRGWSWDDLLDGRRPPAGDDPPPAPLRRGREVLARYRGRLLRGTVVSSQGDRVTVRLRTPHGDVFPLLARVDVQPVGADPGEVVGQVRAARRAGDVRLEALWRAYAVEAGAPASVRLPKTSSTAPIVNTPATREKGQRSGEK